MQGAVLHLMGWDKKFVPTFIKFLQDNYEKDKHRFIIYGGESGGAVKQSGNIWYTPTILKSCLRFSYEMHVARKIILHGMFSSQLFLTLSCYPWLLKKVYWTIWGGDLYSIDTSNNIYRSSVDGLLKKNVISRIGHCITQIPGDYALVREWYGADCHWHECFMYPSNIFNGKLQEKTQSNRVNILIGNSADPSNNHFEALEIAKEQVFNSYHVYCPLSYGNPGYAKEVIKHGETLFGNHFTGLTDFIPIDNYNRFLSEIDVALFNHKRQQAIGNITFLAGMGKKVFLRSDITTWSFLRNIGVKVFDVNSFNLEPMAEDDAYQNHNAISSYFSEKNLLRQMGEIME